MAGSAAALAAILAVASLPGCAVLADLNDVRFETGYSEMAAGDSIVLESVRGNFGTFEPRGVYRLRGEYTLQSRDEATLAVCVLDGDCGGDTSVRVLRGTGRFDLSFASSRMGQPYLALHPFDDQSRHFGILFFGTGASVRRDAPPDR